VECSNHTLPRKQFQSVTCILTDLVARAVPNIKLLDLNLLLLRLLYRALYFGRSCFFFILKTANIIMVICAN